MANQPENPGILPYCTDALELGCRGKAVYGKRWKVHSWA